MCREAASLVIENLALEGEAVVLPKNSTLRDFFYRKYVPYAQVRKKSIRFDLSTFQVHIEKPLGDYPLEKLSREIVENWLTKQLSRSLKKSTVNKHLFLLNRLLFLADRWGLLGDAKYFELKLEKLRLGDYPQKFLTAEEISKLLCAARQDQHPYIEDVIKLLILTGARVGEARNARWEDVLLPSKCWVVPVAKGGRSRKIYLSADAIKFFEGLRSKSKSLLDGDGGAYVLTNPRTRKPYNSFYASWYRVLDRAKLDGVRIHDLRHTYASILINSGVTIYELQKLLGHSTVAITQRYAHLYPDKLHEKTENVANFLTGLE